MHQDSVIADGQTEEAICGYEAALSISADKATTAI
jgi:hypothetical protein